MANIKFPKFIPLAYGSGDGISGISTTSATYVDTSLTSDFISQVYIDPASYSSPTFYNEAVFQTSAATGYVALYDFDGNQISSSEITTTATTPTRVRSSAITLSAEMHCTRFKNDGANTTKLYDSRIVVIQDATTISATETQFELVAAAQSTTNTSYEDLSSIYWGFFRWLTAEWNGTINIYFEAVLKTDVGSGTAYCQLTDSSNSAVAGSEVTTSATTRTRVRSSAISLSNATDYKPRFKASAGRTTQVTAARIIIQQTGAITKTVSYFQMLMGPTAYSATGGVVTSNHKVYYDPSEFSNITTQSFYHEVSENSGGSTTALYLYDDSGPTLVTNSTINASQLSTITRTRSSALTMPGGTATISARANSNVGTIYNSLAILLSTLEWTTTSTSTTTTTSTSSSTTTTSTSSSSTTSSSTSSSITTTSTSTTTTSTSMTTTSTSTTSTSTSTSTTTSSSTSTTTISTSTTTSIPLVFTVDDFDPISFDIDHPAS